MGADGYAVVADVVVSLIVATFDRRAELVRLLTSLSHVAAPSFEVLLVDQNADDRVAGALASAAPAFPVVHLRTDRRGASRARNLGAARARGHWLLFPDDDCWYPPDTLAALHRLATGGGCDFAAGRPSDGAGRTIMGRFPRRPTRVATADVWTCLIEWLVLVRAEAFRAAGGFDECIGPGAGTPWAACEIQDLAIRLLGRGATGAYDPAIRGFHESDRPAGVSAAERRRLRAYGTGCGYVARKHAVPVRHVLPMLARPSAGMALYALTGRWGMARRSYGLLAGRLEGWLGLPPAGRP